MIDYRSEYPCSAEQSGAQDHIGSEPLDPALADRFALFVTAPDWDELTCKVLGGSSTH